jgi:MarR family transcriptional regulator, organic hydroperoxide resistance regulator
MSVSEHDRRERLGNEISALMGGLVRTFRGGFVSCADELGMGPGEAQALWLLSEDGETTTGDLARRLNVDPANASTLLTKLESRGLVRRDPAKHDRRKRQVSPTAEGRKTKLALARCIGSRQEGFGVLSTSELATFRDLLRRVAGET